MAWHKTRLRSKTRKNTRQEIYADVTAREIWVKDERM
jgi:hypothetical protein